MNINHKINPHFNLPYSLKFSTPSRNPATKKYTPPKAADSDSFSPTSNSRRGNEKTGGFSLLFPLGRPKPPTGNEHKDESIAYKVYANKFY